MRVRHLVLAAVAVLATVMPARADLVLEFLPITNPNPNPVGAGPDAAFLEAAAQTGPALTNQWTAAGGNPLAPGEVRFIQVVLRDTVGSGVQPLNPSGLGTDLGGGRTWNLNGTDPGNDAAGPGSAGLGTFLLGLFNSSVAGVPGAAVDPEANAAVVDPIRYGQVAPAPTPPPTPPPTLRVGGVLNTGREPGAVPSPNNQNRIALVNLKIQAFAVGDGVFRVGDSNSSGTSDDNSVLVDADRPADPNGPGTPPTVLPGSFLIIDDLLFGPNNTNTFDLPITVTPEPSSFVLGGLALAGLGYRKLRRRKAVA